MATIKRLRITPGSQEGMSGVKWLIELKSIEISVTTNASQVMTPTVNSKRLMAWALKSARFMKKKPNPGLAYNYRNNQLKLIQSRIPDHRRSIAHSEDGQGIRSRDLVFYFRWLEKTFNETRSYVFHIGLITRPNKQLWLSANAMIREYDQAIYLIMYEIIASSRRWFHNGN